MGRGPTAPAPSKADAQKPAALRSHQAAASPSAAAGSSPPNHGWMEAHVAVKGHDRACMRASRG